MKKLIQFSKGIMLNQIAISFLCVVVVPGVFMFLRDSMGTVLMFFTLAAGLYLFFLDFVESNKIGDREVRNPKLYKAHALKGALLGLIGQLPVWIITVIFILNKETIFGFFSDEFKNFMANICTLQYVWILMLFDFSIFSYIIAFSAVPLIFVRLLLGMKGFNIETKLEPEK